MFKNSRTDTNKGATLLNCNVVVATHAHRKLAKRTVLVKISLFDLVEQLLEAAKFTAHLPVVAGVGGHAHEAGQLHVRRIDEEVLRKQALQFLR